METTMKSRISQEGSVYKLTIMFPSYVNESVLSLESRTVSLVP